MRDLIARSQAELSLRLVLVVAGLIAVAAIALVGGSHDLLATGFPLMFGLVVPAEIADLDKEISGKRKALLDIIAEAKGSDGVISLDRVKSLQGDAKQKADEIQRRNYELNVLGTERDAKFWEHRAKEIETEAAKFAELVPFPSGGPGGGKGSKSLGDLFVESKAFKERVKGGNGPVTTVADGAEVKATLSTAAGWAPQSIRTGRLVEEAVRPIQVLDLIPQGETDQAAVVFMEETTFTNNAAEIAENPAGNYGESALVYTEQTSTVRKIGVALPVTDEQLADIPQIRGIVNGRLVFMLRQRLDSQVLVGTGVAPNLRGLLNATNLQTTAKAAGEPVFDTCYRGARLVRVTGRAIPTGYVFHPIDWEEMRLTRTTEGIYLLGNPSEPGPTRLWGLPVTEGDVITQNTGLTGAFSIFCELVFRRGIDVQVGFVNDQFTKGLQTLRADVRVAFPIYRGEAFATMTGI